MSLYTLSNVSYTLSNRIWKAVSLIDNTTPHSGALTREPRQFFQRPQEIDTTLDTTLDSQIDTIPGTCSIDSTHYS